MRVRTIVLAIVLVVLVAGGIGSYFAYESLWVNNPVWNASADEPLASSAVDSLSPICLSYRLVVASPTNNTSWQVMGIRNRSGYSMDTVWNMTFYDLQADYAHSMVQRFHLAGRGDAYPQFWNRNNASEVARLSSDMNLRFNVGLSLSAVFNVTGLHGVYHFTRFGSVQGQGPSTGYLEGKIIGGQPGMIIGPPPCPDSALPQS